MPDQTATAPGTGSTQEQPGLFDQASQWLTGKFVGGGQGFSDQITGAVKSKISKDPKGFGKQLVGDKPTTPGGGGPTGTDAFSSSLGKSIMSEMGKSPSVSILPRMLMGFMGGGLGGGLSNMGGMAVQGLQSAGNAIGDLFKSSADDTALDSLPAPVAEQMGDQFRGSPAAREAANKLGPMVNEAFNHVMSKPFGGALGTLTNPMGQVQDIAKKHGLTLRSDIPGVQTAKTSSWQMGESIGQMLKRSADITAGGKPFADVILNSILIDRMEKNMRGMKAPNLIQAYRNLKKKYGLDVGITYSPLVDRNAMYMPPDVVSDIKGEQLSATEKKLMQHSKKHGLIVLGRGFNKPGVLAHEMGHAVARFKGGPIERSVHGSWPSSLAYGLLGKAPAIIGGGVLGMLGLGPIGAGLGAGAGGLLTGLPTFYREHAANRYARKLMDEKTNERTSFWPSLGTYVSSATLGPATMATLIGAYAAAKSNKDVMWTGELGREWLDSYGKTPSTKI